MENLTVFRKLELDREIHDLYSEPHFYLTDSGIKCYGIVRLDNSTLDHYCETETGNVWVKYALVEVELPTEEEVYEMTEYLDYIAGANYILNKLK